MADATQRNNADSHLVPRGAAKLGVLAAVALVAAAIFVAPASPGRARPTRQSVALSSLEGGILADVNAFRQQHGLRALTVSSALTAAARQHSRSMAAAGYFAHESVGGGAFWQRVRSFYPQPRSGSWAVGENLLWSSPDIDAAGAVHMWEASPPHRENLLTSRWREIGISAVHVSSAPGIYDGQPVTIVTTDFGVRR
jgi:uncharacterized protein YkwD